jgi:hypothetical protein
MAASFHGRGGCADARQSSGRHDRAAVRQAPAAGEYR